MGTFHADSLGQLTDASASFTQLVGKVFAFELFAGFAQGQFEYFRMLRSTGGWCAGILAQRIFHIINRNFAFITKNQ